MEPTFQSRQSVQKWNKMSAEPGGEDAYFEDDYMLRIQRRVVRKIRKLYEEQRKEGQAGLLKMCRAGEFGADMY